MLKIIKKALGLVLEVAGVRVPGATEGQTLVANAEGVFVPGAGGGGGSLPAGTNGGVMAYVGGAWVSTAAGTVKQVLASTGATAPTWLTLTASDVGAIAEPTLAYGALHYNVAAGEWRFATPSSTRQVLRSDVDGEGLEFSTDVAPLVQRAIDGLGTSVTTCATIAHDLNAGGSGNGIGARCLVQNRNSAGALVDTAAIDGVLTTATSGAEVAALDVNVRSGAALARVARFTSSGLRLDWAARSLTVLAGFGSTELDVWRVDGSSRWCFGSTDDANCGGLRLYTPSAADVSVIRGATTHLSINSSGALSLGTVSHTTAIQGTAVTLAGTTGLQIGYTSVVAVYQGGARVPRRTITASSGGSTHALDASDEVVHVDATAGAGTITLPPPSDGRIITVQRKRGSNNVIVQRNSAETIRTGGANVNSTTISDDARHSFIYDSDSSEWSMEA